MVFVVLKTVHQKNFADGDGAVYSVVISSADFLDQACEVPITDNDIVEKDSL